MNEETLKKKEEIEEFFKTAFVADTAEIVSVSRQERKQFKILSLVKLTDKTRGTFYIASVVPK